MNYVPDIAHNISMKIVKLRFDQPWKYRSNFSVLSYIAFSKIKAVSKKTILHS